MPTAWSSSTDDSSRPHRSTALTGTHRFGFSRQPTGIFRRGSHRSVSVVDCRRCLVSHPKQTPVSVCHPSPTSLGSWKRSRPPACSIPPPSAFLYSAASGPVMNPCLILPCQLPGMNSQCFLCCAPPAHLTVPDLTPVLGWQQPPLHRSSPCFPETCLASSFHRRLNLVRAPSLGAPHPRTPAHRPHPRDEAQPLPCPAPLRTCLPGSAATAERPVPGPHTAPRPAPHQAPQEGVSRRPPATNPATPPPGKHATAPNTTHSHPHCPRLRPTRLPTKLPPISPPALNSFSLHPHHHPAYPPSVPRPGANGLLHRCSSSSAHTCTPPAPDHCIRRPRSFRSLRPSPWLMPPGDPSCPLCSPPRLSGALASCQACKAAPPGPAPTPQHGTSRTTPAASTVPHSP